MAHTAGATSHSGSDTSSTEEEDKAGGGGELRQTARAEAVLQSVQGLSIPRDDGDYSHTERRSSASLTPQTPVDLSGNELPIPSTSDSHSSPSGSRPPVNAAAAPHTAASRTDRDGGCPPRTPPRPAHQPHQRSAQSSVSSFISIPHVAAVEEVAAGATMLPPPPAPTLASEAPADHRTPTASTHMAHALQSALSIIEAAKAELRGGGPPADPCAHVPSESVMCSSQPPSSVSVSTNALSVHKELLTGDPTPALTPTPEPTEPHASSSAQESSCHQSAVSLEELCRDVRAIQRVMEAAGPGGSSPGTSLPTEEGRSPEQSPLLKKNGAPAGSHSSALKFTPSPSAASQAASVASPLRTQVTERTSRRGEVLQSLERPSAKPPNPREGPVTAVVVPRVEELPGDAFFTPSASHSGSTVRSARPEVLPLTPPPKPLTPETPELSSDAPTPERRGIVERSRPATAVFRSAASVAPGPDGRSRRGTGTASFLLAQPGAWRWGHESVAGAGDAEDSRYTLQCTSATRLLTGPSSPTNRGTPMTGLSTQPRAAAPDLSPVPPPPDSPPQAIAPTEARELRGSRQAKPGEHLPPPPKNTSTAAPSADTAVPALEQVLSDIHFIRNFLEDDVQRVQRLGTRLEQQRSIEWQRYEETVGRKEREIEASNTARAAARAKGQAQRRVSPAEPQKIQSRGAAPRPPSASANASSPPSQTRRTNSRGASSPAEEPGGLRGRLPWPAPSARPPPPLAPPPASPAARAGTPSLPSPPPPATMRVPPQVQATPPTIAPQTQPTGAAAAVRGDQPLPVQLQGPYSRRVERSAHRQVPTQGTVSFPPLTLHKKSSFVLVAPPPLLLASRSLHHCEKEYTDALQSSASASAAAPSAPQRTSLADASTSIAPPSPPSPSSSATRPRRELSAGPQAASPSPSPTATHTGCPSSGTFSARNSWVDPLCTVGPNASGSVAAFSFISREPSDIQGASHCTGDLPAPRYKIVHVPLGANGKHRISGMVEADDTPHSIGSAPHPSNSFSLSPARQFCMPVQFKAIGSTPESSAKLQRHSDELGGSARLAEPFDSSPHQPNRDCNQLRTNVGVDQCEPCLSPLLLHGDSNSSRWSRPPTPKTRHQRLTFSFSIAAGESAGEGCVEGHPHPGAPSTAPGLMALAPMETVRSRSGYASSISCLSAAEMSPHPEPGAAKANPKEAPPTNPTRPTVRTVVSKHFSKKAQEEERNGRRSGAGSSLMPLASAPSMVAAVLMPSLSFPEALPEAPGSRGAEAAGGLRLARIHSQSDGIIELLNTTLTQKSLFNSRVLTSEELEEEARAAIAGQPGLEAKLELERLWIAERQRQLDRREEFLKQKEEACSDEMDDGGEQRLREVQLAQLEGDVVHRETALARMERQLTADEEAQRAAAEQQRQWEASVTLQEAGLRELQEQLRVQLQREAQQRQLKERLLAQEKALREREAQLSLQHKELLCQAEEKGNLALRTREAKLQCREALLQAKEEALREREHRLLEALAVEEVTLEAWGHHQSLLARRQALDGATEAHHQHLKLTETNTPPSPLQSANNAAPLPATADIPPPASTDSALESPREASRADGASSDGVRVLDITIGSTTGIMTPKRSGRSSIKLLATVPAPNSAVQPAQRAALSSYTSMRSCRSASLPGLFASTVRAPLVPVSQTQSAEPPGSKSSIPGMSLPPIAVPPLQLPADEEGGVSIVQHHSLCRSPLGSPEQSQRVLQYAAAQGEGGSERIMHPPPVVELLHAIAAATPVGGEADSWQ